MIDTRATPTSLPRRGRPAASPSERRSRIGAIEQAAIDCLETMAAGDIAIDDIARVAGVSRRTFYRFFDGRRALFAQVLMRRATAIGAKVKAVIDASADFPAAVIDGTMATLRLIAEDRVFAALTEADGKLMLDVMEIDADPSAAPLFFATWADVFARARASGALRPSISDMQAAHWLRGIHYMLSLRPDLDGAAKRALLVDFVVPSLTLADHR